MPTLANYKALLFDVDNTLSKIDKTISPATVESLTQLSNSGYRIGVCTGRVLGGVEKYVLPLFPNNSLHVISGGAQIVSGVGQILWQKVIPAEISRDICHRLLKAHAQFMIGTANTMALTPEFKKEFEKFRIPLILADLDSIHSWETPLISVVHLTPEIREIIESYPDLNTKEMMSSFGGTYIDITAHGVSKGTGVLEWCRISEIRPTDVIGFGDSNNDLEFLQMMGFAVAMGNAADTIKQTADRVIGHTNDDGLAKYLTDIMQGAEL